MAKSKWNEVKEKLILVEAWARDGYTDEMIYTRLGIGKDSFYRYKNEHSEFSDALKRGKEVVDITVENQLLQKALGITKKLLKPIKLKEVFYDNGKRISEKERVEYHEEEVYIPPDTTAQIFWLKNRKPKEWRDKQEVESVNHNLNQDVTKLTDEELDAKLEKYGVKF